MQGALCLQLYLEIVKILYLPLTGVPVKKLYSVYVELFDDNVQ